MVERPWSSQYVSPDTRGEGMMVDDAVLKILQVIQSFITALDRRVQALDEKVTRQHAILSQDIRMIRAAIHDMSETRVTKGEICCTA
jgi:hypothetical protein